MSGELSLKCNRKLVMGALPGDEPEALKLTARGAVPEVGVAVSCAVGPLACGPVAVIACTTLAEPPLESVIVSLTLNVPPDVKVCDCVWVLSVQVRFAVPSPKANTRLVIGALPWVEPPALNVTVSGAVPEAGLAVSFAVGLVLPLWVTWL